jgi:hypothetical protein
MFGHLKAEDYTNLIENVELPAKRRAHLQSCARCMATFASVQQVQAQMAPPENDGKNIPEPDWTEFRSSVRDAMLSRSIQRNAAIRRWTGWHVRPAMAWSLSVVLVAGLTAGALLWNQRGIQTASTPKAPATELIAETPIRDAAFAAWSEGDVFDQLAQLNDHEVVHLRELLEAEAGKVAPK